MIRPAVSDDVKAIARLWRELVDYHQVRDDAMPRAAPDGEWKYARRIDDQLDDSHTHVVVAEDDDEIVGFVLGVIIDLVPEMFEQEFAGFIADLYVTPAYRRQGIGRGLVHAMRDWFRSKGVQHFEWYVAASNEEGREFWHSLGGRDVMVRMRAEMGEDET